MDKFGIRFKEERKRKKLTQQELASLFHLDKSSISKYENGHQVPEMETLINFANFFDVSIDYLLGKVSNENSNQDLEMYTECNLFSKRLKKLRQEADLKQSDLAKKLGLSTSTIGMYEQGRRQADPDTLLELSKIFNVSVDYLLGNESSKEVDSTTLKTNSVDDIKFENAQDAMAFILKQPSLMAFGVPDLSDEEIIQFANDILKHIELVSYKYKK